MAAPIVTGTIALMKSLKKDITVAQARNVLYKTGADVYGYIPPMVLVDKALMAVKMVTSVNRQNGKQNLYQKVKEMSRRRIGNNL